MTATVVGTPPVTPDAATKAVAEVRLGGGLPRLKTGAARVAFVLVAARAAYVLGAGRAAHVLGAAHAIGTVDAARPPPASELRLRLALGERGRGWAQAWGEFKPQARSGRARSRLAPGSGRAQGSGAQGSALRASLPRTSRAERISRPASGQLPYVAGASDERGPLVSIRCARGELRRPWSRFAQIRGCDIHPNHCFG